MPSCTEAFVTEEPVPGTAFDFAWDLNRDQHYE